MSLTELIIRLQVVVASRFTGDTTYEEMLIAAKEAIRQFLALN